MLGVMSDGWSPEDAQIADACMPLKGVGVKHNGVQPHNLFFDKSCRMVLLKV
jgi:hypothetical protein